MTSPLLFPLTPARIVQGFRSLEMFAIAQDVRVVMSAIKSSSNVVS